MPIFEYKCNECKKTFEILQLPGRNNELKCTSCGSTNLEKLISAPFLPSSVGRPANDNLKCCGRSSNECGPGANECTPGSCCGQAEN